MNHKLFVLFVLVALLGACNTNPTTNTSTKEQTTTEPQTSETPSTKTQKTSSIPEKKVDANWKLTETTDSSYCFITDMYRVGGKVYVDVDFVQMKDVPRDGGYEIVNANPKIRTFELIHDRYTAWDPSDTSTVEQMYQTWRNDHDYYLEELLKSKTNKNADDAPWPSNKYQIATKKGKVIRLYVDLAG